MNKHIHFFSLSLSFSLYLSFSLSLSLFLVPVQVSGFRDLKQRVRMQESTRKGQKETIEVFNFVFFTFNLI